MGASGFIEVNLGTFPGQSDTVVTVTAANLSIAGLLATSEVEAWIEPDDTADHSADEHAVETINARADKQSIVAGVSFQVRVYNTSQLNEPVEVMPHPISIFTASATAIGIKNAAPGRRDQLGATAGGGGRGTRIYGRFNVGVAWN
jgi:hypothetical protein